MNHYQSLVNRQSSYAEQVAKAKATFKTANVQNNKTFRQVKATLESMCCGLARCHYCEDSMADEIEHFKPKDWYPQACFAWENYLYACGPCNVRKSNQFAVFIGETGKRSNLIRKREDLIYPPEQGRPLLINPRREDPLAFFFLDLQGTGEYAPKLGLKSEDVERADYTIDTLKLNGRAHLTEGRREAFSAYSDRLELYSRKKAEGASSDILERTRSSLLKMSFSAVWEAMKKQRALYRELGGLFELVPEAVDWSL